MPMPTRAKTCQDVPSIQQLELRADLSAEEHVSPSVQIIKARRNDRNFRLGASPSSFSELHHVSSFFIIFHLFNFNSCSFMKAPFSTNVCDTLECNKILLRLIPQSQEAWPFFCAVRIVPAYRMLFYGVLPLLLALWEFTESS